MKAIKQMKANEKGVHHAVRPFSFESTRNFYYHLQSTGSSSHTAVDNAITPPLKVGSGAGA